jgi:hypothetical protein
MRNSEVLLRTGILTIGLSMLAGVSFADTPEHELQDMARRMPPVAPDAGLEKAPLQAPLWCGSVHIDKGAWHPYSVASSYERWQKDGFNSLVDAARIVCAYGDEPNGKIAATTIAQTWINLTGLSYKDAVESLAARVNKEAWDSDHQKLCDALTIPDEVLGEEIAFMKTRRILFGCPGNAQWAEYNSHPPDDLVAYLDQSAVEPDELLRLSLVLSRSSVSSEKERMDQSMVAYPIDSYDFRALSAEKAMKALEAPPYKGNLYARIIVKESLGIALWAIAQFDKEVKKRSSDPDWKELLLGSAQRAIAAYTSAALKYKDEIARSNEFERKVFGPSKRAVAGCEPQLRKDFLTVYRKLEHTTANQAKESLSDPIAGLLYGRLLACMALDGEGSAAAHIQASLAHDVRYSRGPRTAAYYAALETVGKIRSDRERFPVKPEDLNWTFRKSHAFDDFRYGQHATESYIIDGHGVVKTATKTARGLYITFATETHQEMTYSCVNTGRIVQIRDDGSVQYYQSCHETGWVTVNDTAEDITIPNHYTDGIVPGRSILFTATGTHKDRKAFPNLVYADKSKKKLISYYGFPF